MLRANGLLAAWRVLVGMLLTALLLVSASALSFERAHAAELIDVDAEASLQISFTPKGKAIENVQFRLYRVADISAEGAISPCGAFAELNLSLDDTSAQKLTELAASLSKTVEADKVPADYKTNTDASGKAAFKDLPVGLYLVMGDKVTFGRTTATPAPFMVCLPSLSADDAWLYDLAVDAKYQTETTPPPPELPKTGTLWWPVPLMLAAGIALVGFGLIRRRGTRSEG